MMPPNEDKGWYIPQDFKDRVVLHALDNNGGEPNKPLIQLVHGNPGQGKSSGIKAILAALRVKLFIFGGSRFESVDAGRPAADFEEAFEAAEAILLRSPNPSLSAVLVDDIDMGFGNFGCNVQYTVNRQHFVVMLMHLCDRYGGMRRLQRPAVYVTANRPELLDGPLIRDGRCEKLHWEYRASDREEIVQRLFPKMPAYHAQTLTERFPEEPIAFFAGLKRLACRRAAVNHLRRLTSKKAAQQAVEGKWRPPSIDSSLEELIALGEESLAERPGYQPLEETA